PDRVAAAQALVEHAGDEAVVNRLLVIAGGELALERADRAPALGHRPHRRAAPRRTKRQAFVTPDPRDFLDQVLLDLQVEAVRRRRDDETLAVAPRRQAQALEDRGDLGLGNVDADHLARARHAQ